MAVQFDQQRNAVEAALAAALHARDINGVMALLTPGVRVEAPGFQRAWAGQDQVRSLLTHLEAIFSESRYVVNETRFEPGRVTEDVVIGIKTPVAATKDWIVGLGTITMTFAGNQINHLQVDVDRDALVRQLTEAEQDIPAASFRSQLALAKFQPDAAVAPIVVATAAAGAPVTAEKERRRVPIWAWIAGAALLVAAVVAFVLLRPSGSAPGAAPTKATKPAVKPSGSGQPSTSAEPTNVLGSDAKPAAGGGQTLRLSSTILFDRNSSALKPSAKAIVAQVGAKIAKAGSGDVLVVGYTDNLGSLASGKKLSKARAEAVAVELRKAVDGTPITVRSRGAGEANPVAPNNSEANRAKNRRVEITYRP